jgi:hypothetical protein
LILKVGVFDANISVVAFYNPFADGQADTAS